MIDDDSFRPWGRYEVLQESPSHKVKCIYVKPNSRLSYQRHQKRAEHWFIISGIATVTLEGVVFEKIAGETVDIEIGALHRVENKVNFGNSTNLFIAATTLIIGIADMTWKRGDYSFGGIINGTLVAVIGYQLLRALNKAAGKAE